MAEFFTLASPDQGSAYTITAGTRNDFQDGQVRIEPPVHIPANSLEQWGDEYQVNFDPPVVGMATLFSFITREVPSQDSLSRVSNRERVQGALESLATELGYLSSDDYFRDTY
jgi:hypothetical protein